MIINNGTLYHASTIGGRLSDKTHAGLVTQIESVRTRASKFLGRPVTDDEVEHGIAKPPVPLAEQQEARRAKARADYAQRLTDEKALSPEQIRLAAAKARAEEQRRGKLSSVERELEDAQIAATADENRRADEAKRQEIMATKPYQSLRANLDGLLFAARLDSAVSASELAALEAQSDQLESTLDIAAIKANVSQLQRVIDGRLDLQAAELRAATDTLAARRKMLAAGQTFDDVDTEIVGDMTFVVLSVGDKTVKISQQKYDSRESDQSLKASLFGGDTDA